MFNQNLTRESAYNLEPEKPMGWVSLYDGNNIVYIKEIHYTIETNLDSKIFTMVNDYDLAVKIDECDVTFDEFVKSNSDDLDEIVNRYLV